jgi:hypothetical protein
MIKIYFKQHLGISQETKPPFLLMLKVYIRHHLLLTYFLVIAPD